MKTLISICMLMLFVSCGSTFTKVDKVNYARYEHDQKIEKGIGMKEVMDKFGSPHDVKNYGYNGEGTTTFVYYRAIQCKVVYCFVVFDDDKEVINFDEFRQEYVNFLN
jgi:hypothetical protein